MAISQILEQLQHKIELICGFTSLIKLKYKNMTSISVTFVPILKSLFYGFIFYCLILDLPSNVVYMFIRTLVLAVSKNWCKCLVEMLYNSSNFETFVRIIFFFWLLVKWRFCKMALNLVLAIKFWIAWLPMNWSVDQYSLCKANYW